MKLHLGCGERYFEGYINIDYPPENQTVIKSKVDEYADITKLNYKKNSIDEIRLHHVFEHFNRPTALALLCRWWEFLKVGGILRIETPDAMACFRQMLTPWYTFDQKQQVERHLFGSHEAHWAVHWDGWYKEKYQKTLTALGFEDLKFFTNKWGVTRNIEVIAKKSNKKLSSKMLGKISENILSMSTIKIIENKKFKESSSEIETMKVWMNIWRKIYQQ